MGGKAGNNHRSSKEPRVKTPPVLFGETQGLLGDLEARLGGPILTYWVSQNSRIHGEDAEAFYDVLRAGEVHDRLYLYIKSEGGSGIASLRIVHLLRKYARRLIAVVPLDCASAATMLALGSDEIWMGPLAYLSAIDTSIRHELSPLNKDNDRVSVSQDELARVLSLWSEKNSKEPGNPYARLYDHIHPLVFGAVDRASSLSIKLTTQILSYHMDDESRALEISSHLNGSYPSHSYPITLPEAQRIGLNVRELESDVNDGLLELHKLYSEMAQLAYTDYDELNYHDNEILKIIECRDSQVFYQKDKDWHYRSQERRWVPMNDESSWRRVDRVDGTTRRKRLHLR